MEFPLRQSSAPDPERDCAERCARWGMFRVRKGVAAVLYESRKVFQGHDHLKEFDACTAKLIKPYLCLQGDPEVSCHEEACLDQTWPYICTFKDLIRSGSIPILEGQLFALPSTEPAPLTLLCRLVDHAEYTRRALLGRYPSDVLQLDRQSSDARVPHLSLY